MLILSDCLGNQIGKPRSVHCERTAGGNGGFIRRRFTQIIRRDTPLYEQNSQLAPGTQQEKKKARVGYVVETYRVYKRNGVEYNQDLLCTSTYKMIQQVIEYN